MLSFLKSLPQTFYSASFYRRLLNDPKSGWLGFVAVIALLSLLQAAATLYGPARAFWAERDYLFASLPDLEIRDGAITAGGPLPKRIDLLKDSKYGPFSIVMDTQAAMPDSAAMVKKMKDENINLFVAQDAIGLYDHDLDRLSITPASEMRNHKLAAADWQKLNTELQTFLSFFTLATIFISVLLAYAFLAFLGAVFLFIIAPLFKVPAPLKATLRLAAAAGVPVAVVFMVVTPIPAFQVLLWFGFAVFGLLANRPTPHKGASTA